MVQADLSITFDHRPVRGGYLERVTGSIWGRGKSHQFLCCAALHSVGMLYTPNRLADSASWMSRDDESHNVKPMKYQINSILFLCCSRQVPA